MLKTVIAVTTLFMSTAVAQTPQPNPAVPNEYTLKVTPAELDLISEGLQTQPFKQVLPLMNKLRDQVVQQQTPSKPVETPKVEPNK